MRAHMIGYNWEVVLHGCMHMHALCACVCACARVCVCVCVCVCMCVSDFHTHPFLEVSSLFTLWSTATATTLAMAAVSRTPPMKLPIAAPTAILEQPLATCYDGMKGK